MIQVPSFKRLLTFLLTLNGLGSCVNSPKAVKVDNGILPEYLAYVPAKTAVFSCRPWPKGAGFKELVLSSAAPTDIKSICEAFDTFVLAGFKDQPYMRGLSPKSVNTLVERAKQASLEQNLDELWKVSADTCNLCTNPSSFYQATMRKRTQWLEALDGLSKATAESDTLLIPFVMTANEQSGIDRGTAFVRRILRVAMILIDLDTGELIWSSENTAGVSERVILRASTTVVEKIPPPDWSRVTEKVLNRSLWKEYPGRQVF